MSTENFRTIGQEIVDQVKGLGGDITNHAPADSWHIIQQAFTTRYVAQQQSEHPDKCVLVSCQPADEHLVGKHIEETVSVPVPTNSITYKCYVFDSGEFTNNGDGGLINWCFTGPPGSFYRDGDGGKHVVFNPGPGIFIVES
jgi:hypothetical protein